VRSPAPPAVSFHLRQGRSGAASNHSEFARDARFESWFKMRAAAAPVQSSHRLSASIAEEQFDAVSRRSAFDFLDQGRADANMLPVISNRHAEFAGAFGTRMSHSGLADHRFAILRRRGEEQGQSVATISS
jgi:hypothetical protein